MYTTFNKEQKRIFAAVDATNLADSAKHESWYKIGGHEWVMERVLHKVTEVCLVGTQLRGVAGYYSLHMAKE